MVTLDHLFPTAPKFLKAEFVTMVLAHCDSWSQQRAFLPPPASGWLQNSQSSPCIQLSFPRKWTLKTIQIFQYSNSKVKIIYSLSKIKIPTWMASFLQIRCLLSTLSTPKLFTSSLCSFLTHLQGNFPLSHCRT